MLRRVGLGQTSCDSQAQAVSAAGVAQTQGAAMVSVDGGASLAAANTQLASATQALQACQNSGTLISLGLTTAGSLIAPLVLLGTGIASLILGHPATPTVATGVVAQSNTTMILLVGGGMMFLLIIVMMMGKK